jgi:antirestriction protein ArdC
MGAAMLAAQAGIDESVFGNSASYVASWLHRLQDDKKLIIPAAREAMAAADRVLEPSRQAQAEADLDRDADIEAA